MIKQITDAHMHLWDYQSGNYPWLLSKLPGSDKMIGNYDPIRKNFLVDDYIHSFHNAPVKKCVHIQVFGYPENPVLETKWLQQTADESNYPNAIVAYTDFTAPNADESLRKHSQYKNLRGIRNVLCYHTDPDLCMIQDKNIMKTSAWRDGYQLLEKYQLSFDVQLYDHQLDDLAFIAHAYPNIPIVINHFAWPTDFSKNGFANWKDRIRSISRISNVSMKISGVGCVFKRVTANIIEPYLYACLEHFGTDRCLFGSNFPVASLFTNYTNLLKEYQSLLFSLNTDDLNKIFSKNAEKFYKILN